MKRITGILVGLLLLLLCACAAADVAINEANFPDATFRMYVRSNLDLDGDLILNAEELRQVKKINIWSQYIRDLKGIEHFTALETLLCCNNRLETLDVSKNVALKHLACSGNWLTELDVSHNPKLRSLFCNGNQLTELKLDNQAGLECLVCNDNYLTELNLSNKPGMKYLRCENNQMIKLDISDCPVLVEMAGIPENDSSEGVRGWEIRKDLGDRHPLQSYLYVDSNVELYTGMGE